LLVLQVRLVLLRVLSVLRLAGWRNPICRWLTLMLPLVLLVFLLELLFLLILFLVLLCVFDLNLGWGCQREVDFLILGSQGLEEAS